ncbi:GAF and ANTAR domain-containing protein [Aeromicrobium massiliense]|uniref:GAF and ANTAR domain-containing protein n=1 Tax=Aeromicrobium massiliense TaxID=1464554 RepID=UPI0002D3AE0A|nr:GAF and ANTAR domain-containing protein [Aeromicrobium massiliense]
MIERDDELTAAAHARVRVLLAACAQSVGVDGAGFSLARAGTMEPVMGTDDVAEAIERTQFTTGEGPCLDASRSVSPVLVADLQHPGDGHSLRWPAFANEARELGVRAIFALPLRVGDTAIGAADLYRRDPGPLAGQALARALTVANAVTLTLLDGGRTDATFGDEAPLMNLDAHRAAGMIMVQLGVSIDQALVRLRSTAYADGVPVEQLAKDVIDGRRRFEEDER